VRLDNSKTIDIIEKITKGVSLYLRVPPGFSSTVSLVRSTSVDHDIKSKEDV
jgi:hypothetical protein